MKRTYGPGSDPTGWLRQYHRPPAGAPTLVVFPHAGGSATGYYTLSWGGGAHPRRRARG
ncbi:hypothetical protein [Streptomyces sp. NPDC059552]|uniref:hypothetical protein n=1 Tax=Streptomyces sp. NPDC059552 TaxID=3346862 RepID=UPI0036CB8E41